MIDDEYTPARWYDEVWELMQDPTAYGTMPQAIVLMVEIFDGMFKSDVDDLLEYARAQA